MEADEDVNENLKVQFKALQEQQQKRMQNLMEKKKMQNSLQKSNKGNQDEAFGIQDALNLSVLDGAMSDEDIHKKLLENENEQLQQQLREVVDENGRLYKLVKERDFEVKQLHKKLEEERQALMGISGLPGDVAATKIVELAKQNRHMTAEMEKEKTRIKQLNNRIKQLEKELQTSTVKIQAHGDSPISRKRLDVPMSPEMKALHEKLSAANLKVSDYRNQLQTSKQELKMTQKLLANEIGEEVNIQSLLSAPPGSWRGRAQQILVLQGRVRELETQVNHSKSRLSENDADEELLTVTDSRKPSAQVKNQLRIRSLEREKKEALEKLTSQHQALQQEHEDVKKKLEGFKARNKVLSNEVKTLKEQISTLLDKGKHDDELVDALLSQQKEMQAILKNLSQQEEKNVECQQNLDKQLNVEVQKQNCLIEQLKQTVAEREGQVKELEESVRQLSWQQQQHPHQQEEGDLDSLSTLSAESLEDENRFLAPKREGIVGSNSSARAVSKMGHTLVSSAATSFPTAGSPGRMVEPDELDIGILRTQITEYRALCQAAEVERDRLLELVSILRKRVDESITKVWEAEKKFQEQLRKYVALEQQFAKLKMEPGKPSGTPKTLSKGRAAQPPRSSHRMSWNAGDKKDLPSVQLSEVPLESQLEELSTQLAIQMDENEGLKATLEDTVRNKDEDFRIYQETVAQVKEIFLHALKQQKQEKN